jgi:hypothetical protein
LATATFFRQVARVELPTNTSEGLLSPALVAHLTQSLTKLENTFAFQLHSSSSSFAVHSKYHNFRNVVPGQFSVHDPLSLVVRFVFQSSSKQHVAFRQRHDRKCLEPDRKQQLSAVAHFGVRSLDVRSFAVRPKRLHKSVSKQSVRFGAQLAFTFHQQSQRSDFESRLVDRLVPADRQFVERVRIEFAVQ